MEIKQDDIILRDPIETDVDNEIRWWTEETAWQQWETPDSIAAFPGVEAYRKRALSYIRQSKEGHRWSFCIEADGKYIGIVNTVLLRTGKSTAVRGSIGSWGSGVLRKKWAFWFF